MMNKSLRGCGRESSHKVFYGFRELRSFDNRQANVRFRSHRTARAFSSEVVTGLGGENAPKQKAGARQGKKEPPFPAAFEVITGRRQTEWTGATRCPKRTLQLIIEKA
jgi:hypothetical protein